MIAFLDTLRVNCRRIGVLRERRLKNAISDSASNKHYGR